MNNIQQGKLIYPNEFKKLEIQDVVAPSKSRDNSEDGGGNNMDDKYVTHTELELSNEKLLRHMDEHFKQVDDHFNQLEKKMDANKADTDLKFEKVNTKFAEQKNWFYGTAITIVVATCTIVGFLIKFL